MGGFITGEAARERFRVLVDQVDAAYAEMRELSSDEVGNAFRAEIAERLETQERTNRGLMYRMFGELADPPDETAAASTLVQNLAARLRIPPNEVKRRSSRALGKEFVWWFAAVGDQTLYGRQEGSLTDVGG